MPSEHHGPARNLTEIGVFRDCGAAQLIGRLPSPRFAFQLHINLLSWTKSTIPELGAVRQPQKLKIILNYIVDWRSACAA